MTTDPSAPLTPAEIAGGAPAAQRQSYTGPVPEFKLPRHARGKPDLISEYRWPDGRLHFVVCRWDKRPEDDRKTILPCTWDGTRWTWLNLSPTPRPLLNAPEIAQHASAPVLVVEGEKKAGRAREYLPPGWCITSWAGGADNWKAHDWSLLEGRPVLIWPDNNQAGHKAAQAIEAHLHSLGVATAVVHLPPSLPEGWDLGDDLPAKWTATTIRDALMRNLERADVPTAPPDGRSGDDLLPDHERLDDPDIQWQALGAKDGEFFFLSKRSKRIEVLRAPALLSKVGPLQLVPDMAYWAAHAGVAPRKIDWNEIGTALMQACYDRGVYTPRRIRGRGGWIDEGRVIFHNGDTLWVEGHSVSPVDTQSHYIYPQEDRFSDLDLARVTPLTDEEGRLILDIFKLLRWEDSSSAFYVAGWTALAPVCGLLAWRPHLWVTGTRGSGKTHVVNNIVGRVLGPFPLNVKGATTEAGIRSTLGRDARPVIFDEAEPGDNVQTQQRMQALLELIRQASAETDAELLKGSSSHVAHGFNIRSQFLCSSIAVPLERDADESRFVVCSLKQPLPGAVGEEHFARLRKLIARLPPDCAARLLKRQLENAAVIRGSAETLAAAIAGQSGTRRRGDQIGTLLAGVWSLLHTRPIRPAAAEEWAARLLPDPDGGEAEANQENEAHGLIRSALSTILRVPTAHRLVERSLGEMLMIAFGDASDDMGKGEARRALERHGVRVSDDVRGEEGVAFALAHDNANALFKASPYGISWSRILFGLPGSTRTNALRFAGSSHRAIWVRRGHLMPSAENGHAAGYEYQTDLAAEGFEPDDLPF